MFMVLHKCRWASISGNLKIWRPHINLQRRKSQWVASESASGIGSTKSRKLSNFGAYGRLVSPAAHPCHCWGEEREEEWDCRQASFLLGKAGEEGAGGPQKGLDRCCSHRILPGSVLYTVHTFTSTHRFYFLVLGSDFLLRSSFFSVSA